MVIISALSKQLNMHGVFLHVLSDAIGSVIVIVTALVSWRVTGCDALKLYLDPVLRFGSLIYFLNQFFNAKRSNKFGNEMMNCKYSSVFSVQLYLYMYRNLSKTIFKQAIKG